MKLSLLSLLFGSAAAFVPAVPSVRTSVAVNAGIDDLKSIAEKSNPVLKVRPTERPVFRFRYQDVDLHTTIVASH